MLHADTTEKKETLKHALLSWWRSFVGNALRVLTLGWLLRLLPKVFRLSTRHALLRSMFTMLILSLLIQPAMGSVTASHAPTSNADRSTTHRSLLDAAMSPGAIAASRPQYGLCTPPLPLHWQPS